VEEDELTRLARPASLKIVDDYGFPSGPTTRELLYEAVKKLNDKLGPILETVEFSVEDKQEEIVIAIDNAKQRVIRRIPSEEVFSLLTVIESLSKE